MAGVTISVKTDTARRKLARVGRHFTQGEKHRLLQAIGARQLKWVNDNFRLEGRLAAKESVGRRWKPLAKSTRYARRKGSAKKLQDSGRLRQSFVSKVRGDLVDVGSSDDRALWHHAGTKPFKIAPKEKSALAFPMPNGPNVLRRMATKRFNNLQGIVTKKTVRHPGLPARPLLPTKRTAEGLARGVVEAYIDREVRRSGGGTGRRRR